MPSILTTGYERWRRARAKHAASLEWLRALTLLGLGWGFAVALATTSALLLRGPVAGGRPAGGRWELAVGVMLTALGYATLATGYGVLSTPLVRRRRGRWIAAGGAGLLLSGALFWTLLSAGVRWHSGSYITLGAVQFLLNSFEHVSGAALAQHSSELMTVAGVCAALGAAVTRGLMRTGPPRRVAAGGERLAGGLALGVALTALCVPIGKALQTTPELAFFSSILTPARAAVSERADELRGEVELHWGPPLAAGAQWAQARPNADVPNVLLLTLESVGLGQLGYSSGVPGVTPNLDALAERALQVRRVWTTATHSNYAQMAILSSLFPRRGLGLDTYKRLDYPRVLLHDITSENGYATATISSQDESWQGMARFQDTGTATHFVDARTPGRARIDIGSERIAADHETTERALRWLGQQSGPWSLYVNLQSTHFPYELPAGIPQPFQPAGDVSGQLAYLDYPESLREVALNRYKNALHYVDAQIGRIREWLASRGQLDNTLWVITSDHGEMFFEHGLVTHGRTLYEEEARVPLLLHWPSKLGAAVSDVPASTLDVLPTIVAALGLPPHPAHQGRSLLPQNGDDGSAPGVFLNIQGLRGVEGLVCWPFKLTRDWESGDLEMFNLAVDPLEQRDLSAGQVDRTAAYQTILLRHMRAQDRYHRKGNPVRAERFAPRLPACPVAP